MHLYRQSIIIFGIVLPVAVAAAVIAGGYILKSNMVASFDNKQKTYVTYEQGRLSADEIETKIKLQRRHLDRWNEQLSQETASATANHLRKICERLPSKEITQTAFERPSSSGGFGSVAAQKSSQLRIAFRGTFRTMQRAFLELETRMPRLQLQELQITPNTSQSSLLNYQVTYTAWEN
jgi:hypothetical protein